MTKHETYIIEQLRPHERQELIGLATLMRATRGGEHPKPLMAYKNVENFMNANGLTFEEMGEHNPTKSWKIVNETMQDYNGGFYQLGLRMALIRIV